MKDKKERRSDVEVAATSYPFLVEGAAERWLIGTSLWSGLGVGEPEWRGLVGLIEEQWAKGQHRVYEGLLAAHPHANDLLRAFARAHTSVIAAQAQQQPLNVFLRLRGREEEGEGDEGDEDRVQELEEQIWGDLYETVVAGRKHVLSHILELALGLVKEKRTEEAGLVLTAFDRLRAWVLLLAWDSFEGDIGWRQKIVDALWGGDDKAKESVDWAKHDPAWSAYGVLRHRLKIAWWSAAQLLAAPKTLHSSIRVGTNDLSMYTSPFQLANALLSLLSGHSLLHLLRARLADLDLHELRDILQSNPDTSLISQREKTKDENLLLAYHALRRLLLLIDETAQTAPTNKEAKKNEDEDEKNEDDEESEEDAIEDAMEDIKECIGGIPQPVARLAVLEGLYAALFTTTSQHVSRPTTSAAGDGSAAASFIAQEKVVAPVLALIASSLAGLPDSRRKLGLVELVEEAQWRLDLIRAFARSPRGRALVPAHGALPSVMARMSASPDGLAANCLRSWKAVSERYRSLNPHITAEARLSQALQDVLVALRQGDHSLDALLEGLASEEKHLVTSDVAFLARADADVRARLLIQATNGLQALHRASKGLGHLAHVAALLDRLGVLLQPGTTLGSATSRSGMESPLAVQLARSYILSKKEKGSAEHLKEGLKRRANLATMATFHPRRGSDGVRRVDSLPSGSAGDRNLGPDEEKMLRLVAEDDPVADEHFCQKAVERLVLAGKLEEALHFADASLPNGAPDFLLRLLVEKAQDKSTIWQHIAWPLEVCLELLGMCRDRVSPSAPTAEEVERQYRQLSALRDVLQVRVVRVKSSFLV
ncbi:uncharacterized protein ACA1_318870, partial [Acanthamoeba castellanii str. Neff]